MLFPHNRGCLLHPSPKKPHELIAGKPIDIYNVRCVFYLFPMSHQTPDCHEQHIRLLHEASRALQKLLLGIVGNETFQKRLLWLLDQFLVGVYACEDGGVTRQVPDPVSASQALHH